MRFVAIDLETACASWDSICQVGISLYENGREVESFCTLVNPECAFDQMNIGVHGITEDAVIDAPLFRSVVGEIEAYLRNEIVVSHGNFDRTALGGAYLKIGRALPDCVWIDSVDLAKWAWPDQPRPGGYRLAALAEGLGITFDHHDALEDARTAGLVAVAALAVVPATIEQAAQFYGRSIGGTQTKAPTASFGRRTPMLDRKVALKDFAGGEGPLAGHRVIFTGELSIERGAAAKLANGLGAECANSVSRKVTMLVIGGSEPGAAKSSKQVKIEQMIAEGAAIQILSEEAFMALCSQGPVQEPS